MYGKGDAHIVDALRNYQKVCFKGRKEFASSTPDILKYQPRRFWGFLCKKQNDDVGVTAREFATFNEKLFFDENLPVDTF